MTLTIPPGMYGLLGPNGAGKSTLMRMIATLQEPDSATIALGGIDVASPSSFVRSRLMSAEKLCAPKRISERRAFYELCWHLGGAQSDIANLKAEDIDWESRVVSFFGQKPKLRKLFKSDRSSKSCSNSCQKPVLFSKTCWNEGGRATEFKSMLEISRFHQTMQMAADASRLPPTISNCGALS